MNRKDNEEYMRLWREYVAGEIDLIQLQYCVKELAGAIKKTFYEIQKNENTKI